MESYAAVDAYYPATGGGRVALVEASDPTFATITAQRVIWLDAVADYEPGSFYLRELPAIRAVLALSPPLRLLVIDGYCDLDPYDRPGLGRRLHEATGVPVVGVAKTAFRGASHAVPVLRGSSNKPLYVTTAGLPITEGTRIVSSMAGPFRLPAALRRVDALSRGR